MTIREAAEKIYDPHKTLVYKKECTYCVRYIDSTDYCENCSKIHRQEITRISKIIQGLNQWISVNDRLPEEGYYLCAARYGDSLNRSEKIVCYYHAIGSHKWKDLRYEEREVTHWMTLPEFPKDLS